MPLSCCALAKLAYRASQNEKKCQSINTEGRNLDEGTSQGYVYDILIKADSGNVFFKNAFCDLHTEKKFYNLAYDVGYIE